MSPDSEMVHHLQIKKKIENTRVFHDETEAIIYEIILMTYKIPMLLIHYLNGCLCIRTYVKNR